jgi:hypothetical protein
VADESAACSVALTKQHSIDKCVEGSTFGCSGTVANKTMWTKVRAVRHYSAPPSTRAGRFAGPVQRLFLTRS